MPIIENAEIWYAKLDPKRPATTFSDKTPRWEVQLRTTDLEQRNAWAAMNLRPKLIVGKEGEANEGEPILTEDGKKQWRLNIHKNSTNAEKEANKPVAVVDGELNEVDGTTIGNGSIGNIRIFQYDYEVKAGKDKGKTGISNVLMGIQLVTHIVYERPPYEDEFKQTKTTTIQPNVDKEKAEAEDDTGFIKMSSPKAPVDKRPDNLF